MLSVFESTFFKDFNISFNNNIKYATYVFNIVIKEILKSFSKIDENSICVFNLSRVFRFIYFYSFLTFYINFIITLLSRIRRLTNLTRYTKKVKRLLKQGTAIYK